MKKDKSKEKKPKKLILRIKHQTKKTSKTCEFTYQNIRKPQLEYSEYIDNLRPKKKKNLLKP